MSARSGTLLEPPETPEIPRETISIRTLSAVIDDKIAF